LKSVEIVKNFIVSHPENWEELLTQAPYHLRIKQHEQYPEVYLFSYNQIMSDLSLDIPQVCRGIILEIRSAAATSGIKTLSWAFNKFFNYGEPAAAGIDWSSAYIRDKIDGSLVKCFWFNDHWHWTTNNSLDAEGGLPGFLPSESEDLFSEEPKTFADLINYALRQRPVEYGSLKKGYTYFFELVSPYNRIICMYPKTELFLLGARNLTTEQELTPEELVSEGFFPGDFPYPKKIDCGAIETVLSALKALDTNKEGFVVCDKHMNRIKCKTETYLFNHKLKGDQQFTPKHLFECIQLHIQDDIKAYWKELVPVIEDMEKKWETIATHFQKVLTSFQLYWESLASLEPKEAKKQFAAKVLSEYPYMSTSIFFLCKGIPPGEIIDEYFKKVDYNGFIKTHETIS
jgi:hypothetical protein